MAKIAKHRTGAVLAKYKFDVGRFRVHVYDHNGKVWTTIMPRLAAHYDGSKDKAPPPGATDWIAKMGPAMSEVYGNAPDPAYPNVEPEGDCVIAGSLRNIGGLTGNETGTTALSSTPEALKTYRTVCGPGDQGCVITQVLDYMKSNGIPLSGVIHKIDNYVALDTTDFNLVATAIEVFGPAVQFGINLPASWDDSGGSAGFVWDVPTDPNDIVGGHDVPGLDVSASPVGVKTDTWGNQGTITQAALADTNIVSEAYVLLGPDWYSNQNMAPNGIDATTLAADLAMIGQGQVPNVSPPSPPSPPPIPPSPPPPGPPISLALKKAETRSVRERAGRSSSMPASSATFRLL